MYSSQVLELNLCRQCKIRLKLFVIVFTVQSYVAVYLELCAVISCQSLSCVLQRTFDT